jgi:hypothetical protein
MTEPTGNGGGHTTIVQAGIKLGQSVVGGLGPQFLALIIVNVLFLAGLFWFVDARATHTASVLNQLLQACLANQGKPP